MRIPHTLVLVSSRFLKLFEEVAGRFGLQCISGEKLLPQEKKYFADDVHPNSKGAALLVKNLFEALKQPVQNSLF